MRQMRHVGAGRRAPAVANGTALSRHPVRVHALPNEDLMNTLASLPLPTSVSELLSSPDEALRGLQPHFGTRAITGAVDALTSYAPRLPSMPSPQPAINAAVDGVLQPFSGITSSLPSLPTLPAFNFAGMVASSGDGFGSASASASAALMTGPGGDLARSVNAAVAAAAGAAPGEALPPHFGAVALSRGVESLVSWVGGRFSGLELLDPATAGSLTSALSDLRGVAGVMTLPPALGAAGSSTMQQLGASATALAAGLSTLVAQGGEAAGAASAAPDALLASLAAAFAQAQEEGVGGHSLATVAVAAAFSLLAIAASTPAEGYEGPALLSEDDGLTHEYDPDVVAAYWARRPLAVARRSAQVAAEAASFGAALLLDMWTGRLQANEQQRAEQLRGIIERLGPAYVKVAQALSTRVDLLTPAYFEQIQLLQDRVPPFPCEVAIKEMEKAFGGRPVSEVFSKLSDKPVAAASLGQVYRATLRPELGGEDVAVKVQRPGVLQQVALDLLIMRRLAVQLKESAKMNTDWAGVIDAWAVRFFHELDYYREAANADTFRRQMAEAGVEGIVVANVRSDLSTVCVLTTDWVAGEKLSESNAGDIRELCNTLLNAYLIQLLDTGFLHADPHPGNLIRTPEGKICVLDFGLMTEVTPEQRVALVEYIAHLSTQDWGKLALDLQTLGFIPHGVDTQQAGLVEPLGRVMGQLVGGGGAAKVNIDKVTGDLEELGNQYPIQVPPFFALILRAFSVIEGIALRVDPDYAIVGECFPYLAQRLLNDDSPRMRAVLKDVLYGNRRHMDVERLIRVADGLSAFTTDGQTNGSTDTSGAAGGAGTGAVPRLALPRVAGGNAAAPAASTSGRGAAPALRPVTALAMASSGVDDESQPVLSPVVVDTLRSVLRPGSYVSQLLVDEMVTAVDALSRDALQQLVRGVLMSGPATVSMRSIEALGPLRSVLLPLPTPLEVLARVAPAVAMSPDDEEALSVVRAILLLSQRMSAAEQAAAAAGGSAAAASSQGGPRRAARLARELGTLLPSLSPGLAYTGDLFVRALVRRISSRMGEAAQLVVGRPSISGLNAGGSSSSGVAGVPQQAIAMRSMVAGSGDGGRAVGAQQGRINGGRSTGNNGKRV